MWGFKSYRLSKNLEIFKKKIFFEATIAVVVALTTTGIPGEGPFSTLLNFIVKKYIIPARLRTLFNQATAKILVQRLTY